jgi:nucleotide-binding universal stress UspA family protein
MRILIGVTTDESWRDALALGASLCRTHKAEPVLAHIYPVPYDFVSRDPGAPAWVGHLTQGADALIAEAVEHLSEEYGIETYETTVVGNRSAGTGLMDAADEFDAQRIVIGASPGAPVGRFQVGSTAHELFHGSSVPVAIAPAGYRHVATPTLSGLVFSFRHGEESLAILRQAGEIAAETGLPLTMLTVLLRHRSYGKRLGGIDEDTAMEDLRTDATERMTAAAKALPDGVEAKQEIVVGDTIQSAIQQHKWDPNELLTLPSSNGGVLHRVFLGQTTYKLIRASPNPAVVWPRRSLPKTEAG